VRSYHDSGPPRSSLAIRNGLGGIFRTWWGNPAEVFTSTGFTVFSSMNLLFANDTSGTSNPGCQGTVHGLLQCLRQADHRIVSRLPLGYQYRLFSNCFAGPAASTPSFRGQLRLARAWRTLRTGSPDAANGGASSPRTICPAKWQAAVSRFGEAMEPIWREAEGLVVNGEGTIHHDSVGALTLIGLCAAAKRLGKHVALVNCSIFELDPFLLEMLRMHVDALVVREPVTLRYLQARQIPARLSADCLFLAGDPSSPSLAGRTWAEGKLPRVIYTPGVLSGTAKIGEQMVANDIRALSATGREVLYYVVELEDEPLARVAAAHGARIVPLGAIPWQEVIAFLRTAELVVSGRYHINIFSALAGVPFIPMETNTPKMHGLLDFFEVGGTHSIRSWGGGHGNEAQSPLDLSAAVKVHPDIVNRCIELARNALRNWPAFLANRPS
jgi:hypothetical protein